MQSVEALNMCLVSTKNPIAISVRLDLPRNQTGKDISTKQSVSGKFNSEELWNNEMKFCAYFL